MEIFADLVAEQDRLEAVLSGLPAGAWSTASDAPGWTIADVVLHLAQTEEAVAATAASGPVGFGRALEGGTVEQRMDEWVQAQRASAETIFERWRTARRASISALRQADPQRPLTWVTTALRPATLATTRLAEHWAHGLDVTGPLGIPFPDTARLRHVAWLGHSTLPYAFSLAGEPAPAVFCELTAPDGSRWTFGPASAESTVRGAAGDFCRVGARRLAPERSTLQTTGPHGAAALHRLRNFAD